MAHTRVADLRTTSFLKKYMKKKHFFEVTFTSAGVTAAAKQEFLFLPAKCKEMRFDLIYVGIVLHNYFGNHKEFFRINICAQARR